MPRFTFFKSFRHAWRGLVLALKTELNFRIELAIAALAIAAAVIFPITTGERLMVLVVALGVLVLELVNTAVERLVDLMKPRLSEHAGEIKDVMAGAVLLASFLAAAVGVYIFLPHFLQLLGNL